jgi:hypothetical protein
MNLTELLAVGGLILLIAVPFWFATRPVKDPKKLFTSDNFTDDRVNQNNIGPD